MRTSPTVGIFGAGAIGCYVGCWLARAGLQTTLLGRSWLAEGADGLRASAHDGSTAILGSCGRVVTDASGLQSVDVCFVSVKGKDTQEAGLTLAEVLHPEALVVSLQNGRNNVERLESVLDPRIRVVPGVVGFNVRRTGHIEFTETVPSSLYLPRDIAELDAIAESLRRVEFDVKQLEDIEGAVDGKLLLNANNGVSAATGLSVAELMRDRDARWIFGECLREGLEVMTAAGSKPAKLAAMSPRTMSTFLKLPNFIVRPLLRFGSVDEQAVTSTLGDLQRGRPTEIGELNGEIVALGRRHGVPTPVNAIVVSAVHQHERALLRDEEIRYWEPAELRRRCEDGRGLVDAAAP